MSVPSTRAAFKEYCMRGLGRPVIEINVSDDQVEDRLDEALSYYADYHFDGSLPVYYKYQVLQADINNRYLTLPPNIIGAVKVFPVSDPSIRVDDLFNIRYQIALNDLYSLTTISMVPFVTTMTHLSLIEEILVGQQPIRFNRHMNILYLDTDWASIVEGQFLIVEAYQVVSPDEYPLIWSDRWLYRYASALIKKQWGSNLTKFDGMQLPGGVKFNGAKILADAMRDQEQLEHEMNYSFSLPSAMMIE